ncbi:hypothetical protein MPPM_0560 [Methylorubrum populi]|uniref:Uncharacterized protein n=1 Tax=Methylorubrum populi TaxID=223967 RepID=A0A160PAQ6_9HYPH|nr:hypothetical protein [Methylorubrum populi]BAU89165.1 hypothetical protein MPPM_0560 [Methylorubrum populi]
MVDDGMDASLQAESDMTGPDASLSCQERKDINDRAIISAMSGGLVIAAARLAGACVHGFGNGTPSLIPFFAVGRCQRRERCLNSRGCLAGMAQTSAPTSGGSPEAGAKRGTDPGR